MPRKTRRITPDGEGKWKVKSDDASRAAGIYDTQQEAIKQARITAKREKEELVIHGANGRIREARSYGNDPVPPIDKDHKK